MIVPFQIVMDIFLHNSNEWFNGWALHDFLDFINRKYKNRKHIWSGMDDEGEEIVDEKNRRLFRMCFSS